MKTFEGFTFDFTECRRQFEDLRAWLAGKSDLSERDDVLPFFQPRRHLAALFAGFHAGIASADRFAPEFDIFGDFACDLAIGDWERGAYCFVEFEDAHKGSVFEQQAKKATREWGRRFDHGCSQIIDWIHQFATRPPIDMVKRFGRAEITYETVLAIRRDAHLKGGERERLFWRNENLAVNTRRIHCVTFDELAGRFAAQIRWLEGGDRVRRPPRSAASPREAVGRGPHARGSPAACWRMRPTIAARPFRLFRLRCWSRPSSRKKPSTSNARMSFASCPE